MDITNYISLPALKNSPTVRDVFRGVRHLFGAAVIKLPSRPVGYAHPRCARPSEPSSPLSQRGGTSRETAMSFRQMTFFFATMSTPMPTRSLRRNRSTMILYMSPDQPMQATDTLWCPMHTRSTCQRHSRHMMRLILYGVSSALITTDKTAPTR